MGACPHLRCWTLVVALACGHAAAADDLDDARTAVDGSDYVTARAALDKALHAGTASPEELAEIFKLTGIVEGALGNAAPAAEAFARWLELDAKGVLPPGTSPKIARPFKAAADEAKQHEALEVRAHTVAQPPSVSLDVENDPGNLVASVRVIVVADGGAEKTRDGTPGTAIDLPHGHRLDLRIQILDEYGNRVYELGSKSVPLVITGAENNDDRAKKHVAPRPKKLLPTEPEVQHPRPWYLQHVTWGIATVVMAGAAGFFAYETKSDLDQLDALNRTSLDHVYGEAQAVEANAKRDVLIANIAAGAAGAFALGTAVLYLTRPHAAETTAVRAVPTRDGAEIVVGGHF